MLLQEHFDTHRYPAARPCAGEATLVVVNNVVVIIVAAVVVVVPESAE